MTSGPKNLQCFFQTQAEAEKWARAMLHSCEQRRCEIYETTERLVTTLDNESTYNIK
jgi:hypothetical protein